MFGVEFLTNAPVLTDVTLVIGAFFLGLWVIGTIVTMIWHQDWDLIFALGWLPAAFFYLTRKFWKRIDWWV